MWLVLVRYTLLYGHSSFLTQTKRITVRLRLCLCGVVCGCGVNVVVCVCVCVCDTVQWMDGRCAHVKLWPDVLHGRAELPHKLPPEYQRRPGIISYQTTEQNRNTPFFILSFPFLSFSFSFKACSSRACLGKSSLVRVKTLKKSAVSFCLSFLPSATAGPVQGWMNGSSGLCTQLLTWRWRCE